MLRILAIICLSLACFTSVSAVAARAADVPYTILIDGRALTANSKDTGALKHEGVVFVDAVKFTKAFSGLLTFADSGRTVKISVAKHTATFTKGRLFATLDAGTMRLSGAPFIYDGDIYVPLTAFAKLARSKVTIDQSSTTAKLTTPGGSAH